jgi:chromosome segregation protein
MDYIHTKKRPGKVALINPAWPAMSQRSESNGCSFQTDIKRCSRVGLLSGGQKTMTAVALLFAIYMVKPSPFCVLDEIDAPLDDANIGRFTGMLEQFLKYSQFLIITHNKRTISVADTIYGVTMPERGVSRVVSMRFNKSTGEAVSDESEKAE